MPCWKDTDDLVSTFEGGAFLVVSVGSGTSGNRDESTGSDSRTLVALAADLARSVRNFERRVLEPFGVSESEYAVLARLREDGAPYRLSPTVLMRALGCSSGGLTKRLRRIEANRWVSREPDPDDGRGLLVRLSSRGLELERRIDHAFSSAASNRLARLANTRKEAIALGLRELRDLLDRAE